MEHDVQAVRMMYLRLSQEKGRWLMTEELDQIIDGPEGKISYNIIRQNYAGLQDLRNDLISSYWKEVQPLLGNRLPFYLSQHEIAAKYCQASREVKHWLTVEELRESNVDGLSYEALYDTIGGVRTARKMALEMFRGELEKENSPLLKRKKESTVHVFSGDEIIESYFRESEARGCWLNSLQVRAHPELPSHQTVYARIGSFRTLQVLAEERFVFRLWRFGAFAKTCDGAVWELSVIIKMRRPCFGRGLFFCVSRGIFVGFLAVLGLNFADYG